VQRRVQQQIERTGDDTFSVALFLTGTTLKSAYLTRCGVEHPR
jgi:hypothetical protein